MILREATGGDGAAVRKLVLAAFDTDEAPSIADLVDNLVVDPSARPLLSLVAEDHCDLLGQVLFSAVSIEGSEDLRAAILAPLSVAPVAQGGGIGSRLVREGLRRLRAAGIALVFVLGHPDYYRRFGFRPAGHRNLAPPYPIDDACADAWMVCELLPGTLAHAAGTVRCADSLDDPALWAE